MTTIRFRKPAILAAIPLGKHAVIEASAGTGKTFTLEHLVIELLLTKSVKIEQILVLTYTEKAGAELRTRIRQKIEAIMSADTSQAAPGEDAWTINDGARGKLREALLGIDQATIGTIHSFCQKIITENAFSMQRFFEQAHVSKDEIFAKAFKAALYSKFSYRNEFLPGFRLWRKSIENLRNFLKIICQSKCALRPELNQQRLTALLARSPFRRWSAGNIDQSVATRGSAPANEKEIKRLVAKCEELAAIIKSLPPSAAIWDVTAASLPDKVDSAWSICSGKTFNRSLTTYVKHISALRPLMVSTLAAIANTFLPEVTRIVAQEKRDRGLYDFDDMVIDVADLLRRPEGGEMAAKLRRKYRYGIIDEFQDTDACQWSIFQTIFMDDGTENRIYVIGDPKQIIYGFRGANPYVYDDLIQSVQGVTGLASVPLEQNFRSTRQMIDACQEVFYAGGRAGYFGAPNRYGAPISCGNPDLQLIENNRLSTRPPIRYFAISHDGKKDFEERILDQWAEYVADQLKELFGEGRVRPRLRYSADDEPVELGYKDVFILVFSNKEAMYISDRLRQKGIPAVLYKQDGLLKTPEAQDILQLFRAIANPFDVDQRLRGLMTPFFAVPLWRVRDFTEINENHEFMVKLLTWQKMAKKGSYASLFSSVLNESGIIRRELLFKESERTLTNYLHLFEIMQEFANDNRRGAEALVSRLESLIDSDGAGLGEEANIQRLESSGDAVQILTAFKSKGLQNAIVFLCGGVSNYTYKNQVRERLYRDIDADRVLTINIKENETTKPEAWVKPQDLCEFQRLYYVAATRAKALLYVAIVDPSDKILLAPYGQFNQRLLKMAEAGSRMLIRATPSVARPTSASASSTVAWDEWEEPALLTEAEVAAEAFTLKRTQHGATRATSFSKMPLLRNQTPPLANQAAAPEDSDVTDALWEDSDEPEGPYIGGKRFGNFIHKVLEALPLDSVVGHASVEAWVAESQVNEIFKNFQDSFGLQDEVGAYGRKLVFDGLTRPIPLGGQSKPLAALHYCGKRLPEVDFVFPWPDGGHEFLTGNWQPSMTSGSGYMVGTIDLVFESGGRMYFLDWKTNNVEDLDDVDFEAYFVEHGYQDQATIYTLAMVRALGLRTEAQYEQHFGGALFYFLRRLQANKPAMIHRRLTFDELRSYEQTLKSNPGYLR